MYLPNGLGLLLFGLLRSVSSSRERGTTSGDCTARGNSLSSQISKSAPLLVKSAGANSYLILCLSLYGGEGRLKVSKFLSWCVVTSAEQVISTARSRNVVLRSSELVGVFAEDGSLTSQKVILRCALGLDGLSLAWKHGVSCNRADEGGRDATKWSVPSEKSSKEGKRSAILSALRGCVSLLGMRKTIRIVAEGEVLREDVS